MSNSFHQANLIEVKRHVVMKLGEGDKEVVSIREGKQACWSRSRHRLTTHNMTDGKLPAVPGPKPRSPFSVQVLTASGVPLPLLLEFLMNLWSEKWRRLGLDP